MCTSAPEVRQANTPSEPPPAFMLKWLYAPSSPEVKLEVNSVVDQTAVGDMNAPGRICDSASPSQSTTPLSNLSPQQGGRYAHRVPLTVCRRE